MELPFCQSFLAGGMAVCDNISAIFERFVVFQHDNLPKKTNPTPAVSEMSYRIESFLCREHPLSYTTVFVVTNSHLSHISGLKVGS